MGRGGRRDQAFLPLKSSASSENLPGPKAKMIRAAKRKRNGSALRNLSGLLKIAVQRLAVRRGVGHAHDRR